MKKLVKLIRRLLGLWTPEEERARGYAWAKKRYKSAPGMEHETLYELERSCRFDFDFVFYDQGVKDFVNAQRLHLKIEEAKNGKA